MSFSARYPPAVLFTLFSLAVVCAQTPTKQTTKTPRGSVAGRVTIKDKGVAGVVVGLSRADNPGPFESFAKTTTDHDGYYRIGNLAPGPYEVFPSVPAYVLVDNNNQKGKTVIVAEEENVEGINFSLIRGGVITGKVTDADGRALILQQVYLFRTESFQQQPGTPPRPVFASTATMTDDRGIYRMYGLAAGTYKVASGRSEDAYSSPGMLSRSTYKRVFHPDVSEESRATVITVTEGSEANNVDILLGRPQQTFSASGRVIDAEKGSPVPNLRFGLQRAQGPRFEMVPALVNSNVRGEFLIEGLVPGKYGPYMFQGSPQNPMPEMRVESLFFDIVDQDVTGLTIKLTKGASLSGVAVLESDDKTAIQKFHQMQLRAFVNPGPGGSGYGQSSSSPIAPDGSFRVAGLPAGTASLFLGGSMGPPDLKGFMIARVERDGIAGLRGIEVKEGEQITGIRVIVSYGTASIRGVVKFENGSLPPAARIAVRLLKSGEPVSNFMPPPVDARGLFLIEAIPGGVYELRVSVVGGPSTPSKSVKQDVTVQDGVVTDVVVTIDLGATPK